MRTRTSIYTLGNRRPSHCYHIKQSPTSFHEHVSIYRTLTYHNDQSGTCNNKATSNQYTIHCNNAHQHQYIDYEFLICEPVYGIIYQTLNNWLPKHFNNSIFLSYGSTLSQINITSYTCSFRFGLKSTVPITDNIYIHGEHSLSTCSHCTNFPLFNSCNYT